MVWSFMTLFAGSLTLIPTFRFVAGVITGVAGWVVLFLGQVDTMVVEWEILRKRVDGTGGHE